MDIPNPWRVVRIDRINDGPIAEATIEQAYGAFATHYIPPHTILGQLKDSAINEIPPVNDLKQPQLSSFCCSSPSV